MSERNPTTYENVAEGRNYAAKVMAKAAKLAHAALENLTDEEFRADMAANQREAPLRAHMVVKLMSAQLRAEADRTPQTQNRLNVTIIQRAGSNEEWLQMARPHVRELAAKPEKVVDVPARAKETVPK